MNLFQYCLENYGYNEPILTDELQNDSNLTIKNSTLRMNLKRLVDEGRIKRYARGIYFIPKPNSLLKNQSLSINKVIRKKYLYDRSKPIGYQTGIAFANQLNLTAQTAGMIEIVTNKETNIKRSTKINDWQITLRKPRSEIKKDNIKVLQVLDLLNNFEKISEKYLEKSSVAIIDYMNDAKIGKKELNKILFNYPKNTIIKVNESGVYDALTQG